MNTGRTEICRAPSVRFQLFICWESWKPPFYKEPLCYLNYQHRKKAKESFWLHPHWQEIQTFSSIWATETGLIGLRTLFWCVWDAPEAEGNCVRKIEKEGAGGGGRGWIEHQNTLFLWMLGGCFRAQHSTACCLLHPCASCLPLGLVPASSRVAGTCPAGNQHFLMPFGQTMLMGLAWIFLLRSICQLLSETDTVILFSFHVSSAWHMVYHLLQLLIITVKSLWLPLRCFQKDSVFFLSSHIFILLGLIYIQAHTHRHINFTITVSISWRWTLAARQNTAHFDPPGLNEQNLLNQRQWQEDNVKDWEQNLLCIG